jgi:ribosomal protein S18 acetylase RimI-like enzyme
LPGSAWARTHGAGDRALPESRAAASMTRMDVRPVASEDVGAATETIAQAFRHDPVWGVALGVVDGSEGHLRPFWRLYVEGARRYDGVFASPDAGTVSVWIPPGGTELSAAQDAAIRELVEEALGSTRATALSELWDRFDEHHPHHEPHAYLSLLATHPSLAGHGFGQAHLAADLARWDAAGIPTYLESNNPRNNHRYERQGYAKVGQFETILDGAIVTTMWRPVGG